MSEIQNQINQLIENREMLVWAVVRRRSTSNTRR